MARKIIKKEKGPLEIKPHKESVWVCMCGLSKNQPLCDGSHKTVQDELEDEMYEYEQEGHRKKVE